MKERMMSPLCLLRLLLPLPAWLLLLGAQVLAGSQVSWGDSHSKLIAMSKQEPFPAESYDGLVGSLVASESTAANRAWIYFTAAYDLWCTNAGSPEMRIRYATKAIEGPLPIPEAIQANVIIGNSISAQHRETHGEAMLAPRRAAAEAYLRALRRAMDSGLPATRPAMPIPKDDWDIPGFKDSSPQFGDAAARKDREDYEARQAYFDKRYQEVRSCDEVHNRTYGVEAAVVRLYSTVPYRTDELSRIAKEILRDDEAAANLVHQVEANIRKRNGQ